MSTVTETLAFVQELADGNKPAMLTAMLDEQNSVYEERSYRELVRIRATILVAFEKIGLPEPAIPFVLEELQTSRHPLLIAAAAKALRGRNKPFTPSVPYLIKALYNITHSDDYVSFEYNEESEPGVLTTGFNELTTTLKWFGSQGAIQKTSLSELTRLESLYYTDSDKKEQIRKLINSIGKEQKHLKQVDDCCDAYGFSKVSVRKNFSNIAGVILENHNNERIQFSDYFIGKPTVVAFFYTRCDNPEKCSLTITRFAGLQRALQREGLINQIKMACITYDSNYDLPFRIKNYCQNRNFLLDEGNCAFRVVEGFERLQSYFALGVSYAMHILNRHKVELYILNRNGKVKYSFTRIRWNQEMVIHKINSVLNKSTGNHRLPDVMNNLYGTMIFMGTIFMPKCPFCLAAYASALGITGISTIDMYPWIKWILFIFLGIHLGILYFRSKKNNNPFPFYLSVAGSVLLIIHLWEADTIILFSGIFCILFSAVLNFIKVKLPYQTKKLL